MTTNNRLFAGIPNRRTTRGGGFGGIRRHKGRDSVAATGTTVYASGVGVVEAIGTDDPVYGYWVRCRYNLGSGQVKVLDGHLSKILVRPGETVTALTALAKSGGKKGALGAGISTSAHLHEGVWVDDVLRDPDGVLWARESMAGEAIEPIGPDPEQPGDEGEDMQSPLIVRVDLAGTWKGRYVIGADGVTRVPDGAEGTKRIDWIALCFDLPSNGAPHYDAKFAFTDDATGTLIRRLLLDVAAVPLDFDVTESTPYIRVKHIMGGVVGAPSAFPSSGTFAFDS